VREPRDGERESAKPVTCRVSEASNGGHERRLSDPYRIFGGCHVDIVPPVVDWRLEVVQVPVSDVDRAKAFYTEKAGFNLDHDHRVSDRIRFIQLTPPGSTCSIALGTGLGDMPPGSIRGLQLVVPDIHAARAELVARGVEVSEVQEFPWGSFLFFNDPDGNGWAVQEPPASD